MKKLIFSILILLSSSLAMNAQQSPDHHALEALLTRFLDGASVNDSEVHDRFWGDDLIYTSSNGERVSKEEIMQGLQRAEPAENLPNYHAENTDIRLYDDMAVVAFKLVAISIGQSEVERMEFYNTGTFQKRDGEWKAVAWQATRIPQAN